MRKKLLLNELRNSLDREEFLKERITALEFELQANINQTKELEKKLESLKSINLSYAEAISELSRKDSAKSLEIAEESFTETNAITESAPIDETITEPTEEASKETVEGNETVTIEDDLTENEEEITEEEQDEEVPVPSRLDLSDFDKLSVTPEMEYASETIGKIVVKCASTCNDFAKVGGMKAKELINLALGKAEVFKADCLTIASSDIPLKAKKEYLDRIRRETEMYFDRLKKQNWGD